MRQRAKLLSRKRLTGSTPVSSAYEQKTHDCQKFD